MSGTWFIFHDSATVEIHHHMATKFNGMLAWRFNLHIIIGAETVSLLQPGIKTVFYGVATW